MNRNSYKTQLCGSETFSAQAAKDICDATDAEDFQTNIAMFDFFSFFSDMTNRLSFSLYGGINFHKFDNPKKQNKKSVFQEGKWINITKLT